MKTTPANRIVKTKPRVGEREIAPPKAVPAASSAPVDRLIAAIRSPDLKMVVKPGATRVFSHQRSCAHKITGDEILKTTPANRIVKMKPQAAKRKPASPEAVLAAPSAPVQNLAASPTKTYPLKVPDRRSGPLTMANGTLERCAAVCLFRTKSRVLDQTADPEYREFVFHCVYVPLYSLAVIKYHTEKRAVLPLLLYEYATYYLAFERLLFEIIFVQGWNRKTKPHPKKLTDFFINPPGGYAAWWRRFEEWRASVQKSHAYFTSKQAPDMKNGGDIATAAYLGNLFNRAKDLPADLIESMGIRIVQDEALLKVFRKNALKPKPARWGEPELDTWLIEIWPLVTKYGWNYSDVWRAALAKCGDEGDTKESLGRVEKLEDRCKKMLSLRLAPRGQARVGRVKNDSEARRLMCGGFACSIVSIGMEKEKWIFGGPLSKIIESPLIESHR